MIAVAAPPLAHDGALPARDQLLDAERAAALLGTSLGRRGPRFAVRRVKYRRGESLRITYAIAGGSRTDLLSVRVWPVARRVEPPPVGAAVVDRDLGLAGWLFPSDRRIRHLRELVEEPTAVLARLGVGADSVDLVNLAAEKRATLAVGRRGVVCAYAKVYAEQDAGEVADLHEYVAARLGRWVSTPRVVAVDTQRGIVVYSVVPGQPVGDAAASCASWTRVGQVAARLHEVPVGPAQPEHDRLSVRRLEQAAAIVGGCRPDVASRMAEVVDRLVRSAPPAGRAVTLHGDLHAKNVVATTDSTGLVDLDQVAWGDPAADLGSAAAALRTAGLVDGAGRDGDIADLLAGYRGIRPLPDDAVLAWHEAAALVAERALRAVNRVRRDVLAVLPEVIEVAGRRLDDAERGWPRP